MKTQPKLENIPVVIVSADFPYQQEKEECLQEGATDFSSKASEYERNGRSRKTCKKILDSNL